MYVVHCQKYKVTGAGVPKLVLPRLRARDLSLLLQNETSGCLGGVQARPPCDFLLDNQEKE